LCTARWENIVALVSCDDFLHPSRLDGFEIAQSKKNIAPAIFQEQVQLFDRLAVPFRKI
jgi:hypothetical protein